MVKCRLDNHIKGLGILYANSMRNQEKKYCASSVTFSFGPLR